MVSSSEQMAADTKQILHDAALGEQIFDISETQAETVIQPDGVTDDFREKAVPAVAWWLARHPPTLPPAAST